MERIAPTQKDRDPAAPDPSRLSVSCGKGLITVALLTAAVACGGSRPVSAPRTAPAPPGIVGMVRIRDPLAVLTQLLKGTRTTAVDFVDRLAEPGLEQLFDLSKPIDTLSFEQGWASSVPLRDLDRYVATGGPLLSANSDGTYGLPEPKCLVGPSAGPTNGRLICASDVATLQRAHEYLRFNLAAKQPAADVEFVTRSSEKPELDPDEIEPGMLDTAFQELGFGDAADPVRTELRRLTLAWRNSFLVASHRGTGLRILINFSADGGLESFTTVDLEPEDAGWLREAAPEVEKPDAALALLPASSVEGLVLLGPPAAAREASVAQVELVASKLNAMPEPMPTVASLLLRSPCWNGAVLLYASGRHSTDGSAAWQLAGLFDQDGGCATSLRQLLDALTATSPKWGSVADESTDDHWLVVYGSDAAPVLAVAHTQGYTRFVLADSIDDLTPALDLSGARHTPKLKVRAGERIAMKGFTTDSALLWRILERAHEVFALPPEERPAPPPATHRGSDVLFTVGEQELSYRERLDPQQTARYAALLLGSVGAYFQEQLRQNPNNPKLADQAVYAHGIACERGGDFACDRLWGSEIQPENPKRSRIAMASMKRGCEAGSPLACTIVGQFLLGFWGGRQDFAAAAAPLERGCTLGGNHACNFAGELAWLGGKKEEAKRLYELACTRGSAPGCLNAGDLATTYEDALQRYQRGCDFGNQHCCGRTGRLLLRSNDLAARAAGLNLMSDICEQGIAEVCAHLGEEYLSGEYLAKDPATGRALLEKACKAKFEPACRARAEER